jgi:hemerythrin
MAIFVWDNRFVTNIEVIDQQHQKLIGLLNDLHEAMKQKRDAALIGQTINELVVYTVYHFRTEEELLAKYEYPGLNNHKAEHAYFTKEIYSLQERYSKGSTVFTTEILSFLKDWVNDHILGIDKSYAAFLRNKGAK